MTVDYTINNLPAELVIGRRTETGVFDVRIDCAPWLALWPELVLIIWVTPPGGGEQYPATTHMEGDVLVWDVNIVDTAVEGKGTMEVMGLAEGLKKLSTITTTQVLHTTTVSESEIPDSAQGWVDQVLSETAHNVNEAKNSATSAAGYATSAAQSAEAAGASESVVAQSAQASEASAQRAAQSAEDAAQAASQAAAQAAEEAADQTATEILSTIDGVLSQRDRVWNLLDNSNFLQPVNQRGETSYTGNKYSIDRWRAYHASTTHTVTASGLAVSATDANPNLYQVLDATQIDTSKTYTAAACDSSGNIYVKTMKPTTTSYSPACVYLSGSNILFRLNGAKTWRWAALYEGEYTVETLPTYMPKGYAAELAECQRYYRKYGMIQFPAAITSEGWASVGIDYTGMRVTPTVQYELAGLYVGNSRITSVQQITARALPASELLVDTGASITAFQAATIRFNSLALSADL